MSSFNPHHHSKATTTSMRWLVFFMLLIFDHAKAFSLLLATQPRRGVPLEQHRHRLMDDPLDIWERIDALLSGPSGKKIELKADSSIENALFHLSEVFADAGTVYLGDELWDESSWLPMFESSLSADEVKKVQKALQSHEIPVDALVRVARPAATFGGRGGETVVDDETTIRKALEIPAGAIPFYLKEKLNKDRKGRPWPWEEKMKPMIGKKWEYKLQKLRLYGPGGKFEDHVDTLHDPSHVATVVVCLPSKHEGGMLSIEHLGKSVNVSFAGEVVLDWWIEELEYVAFLADCKHSISKVTSGWCVIAQYDVYESNDDVRRVAYGRLISNLEGRGSSPLADSLLVKKSKLAELVVAVEGYLASLAREHPKRQVAFFLRHCYSQPALELQHLRGTDREIYDAFQAASAAAAHSDDGVVHFEVSVQNVRVCKTDPGLWPMKIEALLGVYLLTEEELRLLSPAAHMTDDDDEYEYDDDEEDDGDGDEDEDNSKIVDLIPDGKMASARRFIEYGAAADPNYGGNSDNYFTAIMVIGLAAVDDEEEKKPQAPRY